jgi:mono/diheme cytochrome c family protein
MKAAVIIAGFLMLTAIGAWGVLTGDDAVDHGTKVYAMQKCALCHSIGGIGGKKLALDGVGSRLKPDAIQKWIRTPKVMKADTTMKSYPNLPEKDLAALTEYLMTLR